jgi:hypothetical protein
MLGHYSSQDKMLVKQQTVFRKPREEISNLCAATDSRNIYGGIKQAAASKGLSNSYSQAHSRRQVVDQRKRVLVRSGLENQTLGSEDNPQLVAVIPQPHFDPNKKSSQVLLHRSSVEEVRGSTGYSSPTFKERVAQTRVIKPSSRQDFAQNARVNLQIGGKTSAHSFYRDFLPGSVS